MIVVLLGPPGSGKGTQAKYISQKYNVPHISTGDIFRKNIGEKTELGIKAKEYIDKGQLVPDELTIQIVKSRIVEADCKNGFLLDGFPRTIAQAEALDKMLLSLNKSLGSVLNIQVSDKKLIERLSGRRVCPACGASYHVVTLPSPKGDFCGVCGAALVQRADDCEDTIKNRLIVYKNQTHPLIEYYKSKSLISDINGEQDIDKVLVDICNALGSDNK